MASRIPAFACLLLAAASLASRPLVADERPNILFIFTDDQAPWALGAAEYPHAKTPHMDRLVREGAYLVNSFTTTPVCSPSRASLLTSRYGSELGITDWLHPSREANRGLDPATITWPELIQAAGYRTGLVGKWHLGLLDRFHPTKTGFDYFFGFRGGGNRPKDPDLEEDGVVRKFKGLTPDLLTSRALEFVRRNRSDEFLLCVNYRAPHARWLPVADSDWAPFERLDPKIPNPDYPLLDKARVKRMTREYLASVHSVDRNVGRILSLLDELDLSRRTVVVFSSDHGYSMGHNGIWHKGNGHWVLTKNPKAQPNVPAGQRPNMYDLSIRVPTIVRWPKIVKPRTRITQTVSNLDWFPTLLEIAGAKLPAKLGIRGRSIKPLLEGNIPADWENGFYAEYSTHHQSKTHMRMYRTPKWKLVRDFRNRERDEFYDLTTDPAETRNQIDSTDPKIQAVIERFHGEILRNMKANNDSLLAGLKARK